MEAGVEVWYKDGSQWLLGTVKQKSADGVVLEIKNNKELVAISVSEGLEELENVKLCNDPLSEKVEDLINLPHLHEPAVLHCLEQRYRDGDIYTYTGPILIAVNPFKRLDIYGKEELRRYYHTGLLKSQGVERSTPLPPHVFAIADSAYHNMMGALNSEILSAEGLPAVPANQSILISGESGAGKTESTKIVLKYLTTVGNGSDDLTILSGSIMDKILQSNPILEAFGNAATLRNDNSSRFGKYIQLCFSERGSLVGGSIETYLLEKVRLPFQQRGQRNFHIFYQLTAGANSKERARWGLLSAEEYRYTNQGNSFKLRDVDDAEDFRSLLIALETLRFPADLTQDLFQVIAGLLQLGQMSFVPDVDGEGSELGKEDGNMQFAELASQLLGVSFDHLIKCVTIRNILAMNEVYEKRLNATQAGDARDALARHVYSKIFSWIVETINFNIELEDQRNCKAKIGVLDIFGFECFDRNSFEQLCINYTNESLQQQFNHFMFKTEHAEYLREKINALSIEFVDNQDCLDLIDHRISGILAVLDDECRLPKGSDGNFAARLYKTLSTNQRFSATATQIRNGEFVVNHFAGGVCYNTAHFVDKNRDELPKECTNLFCSSNVELLSRIFNTTKGSSKPVQRVGGNPTQRLTVGIQFKEQLAGLIAQIQETTPHYIRCLKPNDQNAPDSFNRVRCNEQLRYGGVLEAVRVARSGFPVRLSHSEFYSRYQPLANPFSQMTKSLPRMLADAEESPKEMCALLLKAISDQTLPAGAVGFTFDEALQDGSVVSGSGGLSSNIVIRFADFLSWHGRRAFPSENIQLGLTKVFFRKQAHDILEGRRSRRLVRAAVKIQSSIRGYMKRSMFLDMKMASMFIQRVVRGMISRVRTHLYRINRAATKIQAMYRSHTTYFQYTKFVMAVVVIQSSFRSRLSRKDTFKFWFADKITRLQEVMLRLMYRRRYTRFRRAVIYFQSAFRRKRAALVIKSLRLNARDLGLLKQSNEALKAEIKLLRKQANAETTRAKAERRVTMELHASRAKDQEIEKLVAENVLLKAELQEEQASRARVESQLAKILNNHASEKRKLYGEIAALQEQVSSLSGAGGDIEQLKVDLEMAMEELSREHAVRKALEKEIDRLTGQLNNSSRPSGAISPLYRSSPRMNPRSSIPRYIGSSPDSSARGTPLKGAMYTPPSPLDRKMVSSNDAYGGRNMVQFSVSKATDSSSGAQPRTESARKNDVASITHFMRRESHDQRRRQEVFRGKLKQGVLVFLYDQVHNVRKKAMLRMDKGSDELYVCHRLARFSSVPTKMTDIKPINFSDILECVPGALVEKSVMRNSSAADIEAILSSQCFLTIVSHNASSGSRNLILLMETRDERNNILQSLRALTEEIHAKNNITTPTPVPPPPSDTPSDRRGKVPNLSLGGSPSAHFLSPTTASRRKSLKILTTAELEEAEIVDTPRTAQKKYLLFEKASARKQALLNASQSKCRDTAPATFARHDETKAQWNPELKSYEQPTHSFLKSAEAASVKKTIVAEKGSAIWRPSGISPYLSSNKSSRLLNGFDDVSDDGSQHYRPPPVDVYSPDKDSINGSPYPSSSKRRWSMSSNGSNTSGNGEQTRSPNIASKEKKQLKSSPSRPKNRTNTNGSNSDGEEIVAVHPAASVDTTRRDGNQSREQSSINGPLKNLAMDIDVVGSSPSKKKPPLFLKVETANHEPSYAADASIQDITSRSAPHRGHPFVASKTPDGADSSKKFSFKNYMLDEASAALSVRAKEIEKGSPSVYTAENTNIVSPGTRIRQKFSNPSPSLQRFLGLSSSSTIVSSDSTEPIVPSVPSGVKPGSSFSFLQSVQENTTPARAAEIEHLKNERSQRTVEDLSRDVVQRKEPTGEEKRLDSAFEGQVKQRVLEDAKFQVARRLEQGMIENKESKTERAHSEEYEEFY